MHRHKPIEPDDLQNTMAQLDVNSDQKTINKVRDVVLSKYSALHKDYKEITDKEEKIFEIEGRAHWQALRFRVLTTALIGLTIMLLYWFAQSQGIQMPMGSKNVKASQQIQMPIPKEEYIYIEPLP